MRILWFSNAPWAGTGYGVQTRFAMQYLSAQGHAVAIACNWGLQGARLVTPAPDGSEDGIRFYPAGYDRNSNDIVQAHANDFEADVIVSLYDVWPLKIMDLKTPWLPWTMVDHQPVIAPVVKALYPARRPIACSQFGLDELRQAGFTNAGYIPLGTDLSVFRPTSKREARERLGLPQDKWIAGMVAANKSYPTRKNFPQVLAAWSRFIQKHDDALLYLHTEEQGVHSGVDLRALVDNLGLTSAHVRVCDQYQYAIGFPDPYMVDIYNALDVLVNPAMSEGFGVPIVEAQACGTPVIGCDNSSMPELIKSGLLIQQKDCERWWHPQGGWDFIPHEAALVDTLDLMYRHPLKSASLHEEMRPYDWATSIAPMWTAVVADVVEHAPELAAYGL